jgi:hypothetical protein
MNVNLLSPRVLLRVEGAVVLAMSIVLFSRLGGEWLLFAFLILAPDLSAIGYLSGNAAVGAALYNLFHTYLLPGILAITGVLAESNLAVLLSLIWFAHIGADRLFGYGLKYATGFRDNHLQRV